MANSPVEFVDRFPERDRSRIEAALRRVAIGEGRGRWPAPPRGILVTQELTDGRSGALVLRIEVELGRRRQQHTRIAKIGQGAAEEWKAYLEIFGRELSPLCPPIEAVTQGVLDAGRAVPGEDEALIYADVEQFAGADATSLENLVATAANGDPGAVDGAVAVIDRLLHLATSVLYDDYAVADVAGNRQPASCSLGPALLVRAERVDGIGPASSAGPASLADARRMLPRDVLLAAHELAGTGDPEAAADLAGVGSAVLLPGFELQRDEGRWIASRDYVTVELTPQRDPGELAALAGSGLVTIHGTVLATRSAATWERIGRELPGTQVAEPGVAQVAGIAVAHPFAALRQLLMDPIIGLVTTTVHGDLNPRNVLIAGTQPFLIDYARARPDEPILGDLAWLEINLLRGPFAATLSFAELVHVQRLLALGDRVASTAPDLKRMTVDQALSAAQAGGRPQLTAALRILGAIRHHARLIYPSQGGAAQPWWREYAAQLALAAHRTFKWPADVQSQGTWRAQVAAAAVATEQLLGAGRPWRLWRHSDLSDAATAILPLLPPTRAALPVLGDLVSDLDRPGPRPGGQLEQDLRRARASILSQIQSVAPARMSELQRDHDRYIDLRTTDLAARQPPDMADYHAGSAARSVIGRDEPGSSAVTIAADCAQLVVVGGSGTGKTALLDELEYRRIHSVGGALTPGGGPADDVVGRLPIRMPAPELARAQAGSDSLQAGIDCLARLLPVTPPADELLPSLLAIGAVHLMVDDFDKIPAGGREAVTEWLTGISTRFPRVMATVCHRGSQAPAELGSWRAVRLCEPSDEQVLGYLARCSATSRPGAAAAAALVAPVGDLPGGRDIRALTRNPLLLSMLASTSGGADQPRTVGDLVDAYVHTLKPRLADGSRPGWIRCAEAFADRQISSAEVDLTDESLLADADPDIAAHWGEAREQLAELGILALDGSMSRFRLQIYQDYFAARVLRTCAETDLDELTARALRFAWRDAFAVFVSFTSTAPDVLHKVIHAVADADPGYAARLLRSAAAAPDDLISSFVTEQERVLRQDLMGRVAQERAAQALAAVAVPASYRRLLAVLSDATAGQVARELSLTALVGAHRDARPGRRQSRLSAELTARLRELLAGDDTSLSLRVAVLRVIGDLSLRGLELLVAERIDRTGPWQLVREARSALTKLGVLLPDSLAAAYGHAAAVRLTQIERELPAATSTVQANQLQAERYRLLDDLHGPGRLAQLLDRRFAFEIGELVGELIDESEPAAGGLDVAAPDWLAILTDRAAQPAERLVLALGGPDGAVASAAAHRLLRAQQPDLVVQAFLALTEDGRVDRALIAATMAQSPDVPIGEVVTYLWRLLREHGEGDSPTLQGVAALAQAISVRDQLTGIRVVWQAHRFLTERGLQERLRWPWSAVMARFGGTLAQLDALLAAQDAADFRLAVDALATSSFLLIAGTGPRHRFSAAACGRLLRECGEMRSVEISELLLAAAAVDLPRALTAMFGGSARSSLRDAIARIDSRSASVLALPGYGLIEVAPQAEALAAIGYLARLRSRPDDMAEEVHRLLSEIDLSDAHPSVPIARLIGLAYLGDWQPALRALGSDDPRLPVIARNAIELWSPGPWTPVRWAQPTAIASWIADLLADPGVAPESRSTLLQLKRSAEQRAGALVRLARG